TKKAPARSGAFFLYVCAWPKEAGGAAWRSEIFAAKPSPGLNPDYSGRLSGCRQLCQRTHSCHLAPTGSSEAVPVAETARRAPRPVRPGRLTGQGLVARAG